MRRRQRRRRRWEEEGRNKERKEEERGRTAEGEREREREISQILDGRSSQKIQDRKRSKEEGEGKKILFARLQKLLLSSLRSDESFFLPPSKNAGERERGWLLGKKGKRRKRTMTIEFSSPSIQISASGGGGGSFQSLPLFLSPPPLLEKDGSFWRRGGGDAFASRERGGGANW